MNPGQAMFSNFLMGIVKDDKKEVAEKLLQDCFKKQDEGTFTKEFLESIVPTMFEVVKPEKIDELKNAMKHFASNL